jgi:methionyl aminopeptidase
MIEIKSKEEIEKMRVSGRLAAETLSLVRKQIKAGMTTDEINTLVHEFTLKSGAIPAPLNYRGARGDLPPFPKSCCTSVNNVVCHGIPSSRRLRDGDIVNVDVTCILDGFHGDTSATFVIGTASKEAQRVTEVAERALQLGIEEVKPGERIGNIGAAIQEYVEREGFSVVRDFVGHGIGRKFHTSPQIFHHGTRGTGIRMQPGMIFTIEPMVNVGVPDVFIDSEDEWTVYTADGQISAQFEHTILVTETGYEILTNEM